MSLHRGVGARRRRFVCVELLGCAHSFPCLFPSLWCMPDDMECISCLACSEACKFNAINLEVGGVPISNQPGTSVNPLKKTEAQ